MFRRLLSLLVAFPVGAVLVAIAVSNRQPATLVLDPFNPATPAVSLTLPFYGFLLAALIAGALLGGFATWLGQSRWRQTARTQGQRATRWQAEADRLARERDQSISSAAPSLAIGSST